MSIASQGGSAALRRTPSLLEGAELSAGDLDAVLGRLAPERRPEAIRVVGRIPTSSWYRPLTGQLRADGISKARPGCPVSGSTTRRATNKPIASLRRRE